MSNNMYEIRTYIGSTLPADVEFYVEEDGIFDSCIVEAVLVKGHDIYDDLSPECIKRITKECEEYIHEQQQFAEEEQAQDFLYEQEDRALAGVDW